MNISAYSYKSLADAFVPLMTDGGAFVGLDFDNTVAWPAYNWMGVAKSALESINRYLAVELGPQGIRCNLVAAGPVKTMAAKSIPGFKKFEDVWDDRAPARLGRHRLLGRRQGVRRAAQRLVPGDDRRDRSTSTAASTPPPSDPSPARATRPAGDWSPDPFGQPPAHTVWTSPVRGPRRSMIRQRLVAGLVAASPWSGSPPVAATRMSSDTTAAKAMTTSARVDRHDGGWFGHDRRRRHRRHRPYGPLRQLQQYFEDTSAAPASS